MGKANYYDLIPGWYDIKAAYREFNKLGRYLQPKLRGLGKRILREPGDGTSAPRRKKKPKWYDTWEKKRPKQKTKDNVRKEPRTKDQSKDTKLRMSMSRRRYRGRKRRRYKKRGNLRTAVRSQLRRMMFPPNLWAKQGSTRLEVAGDTQGILGFYLHDKPDIDSYFDTNVLEFPLESSSGASLNAAGKIKRYSANRASLKINYRNSSNHEVKITAYKFLCKKDTTLGFAEAYVEDWNDIVANSSGSISITNGSSPNWLYHNYLGAPLVRGHGTVKRIWKCIGKGPRQCVQPGECKSINLYKKKMFYNDASTDDFDGSTEATYLGGKTMCVIFVVEGVPAHEYEEKTETETDVVHQSTAAVDFTWHKKALVQHYPNTLATYYFGDNMPSLTAGYGYQAMTDDVQAVAD